MTRFWEIGWKWHFFYQYGTKTLDSPNLVLKIRKFLEMDFEISTAQTDGQRHNKSQPRCGGPKRAKTTKTRFLSKLSLSFFINRPKIQFKYAKLRKSYDHIWEIGRNIDFWPKIDIFPKRAKTGFPGKIRKCYFCRIRKPKLCVKFQKILRNGFWDLPWTDEWTNSIL